MRLFLQSVFIFAQKGGPLWGYDPPILYKSGIATSAVIGASLGCVILLAIVIMSIVLTVKRHSLARCIESSNARHDSRRPRGRGGDTVDHPLRSGEAPPPYIFAPYTDPPPYTIYKDRYDAPPPAYELVPLNQSESTTEEEAGTTEREGLTFDPVREQLLALLHTAEEGRDIEDVIPGERTLVDVTDMDVVPCGNVVGQTSPSSSEEDTHVEV